jgi:hypothetical protein
MRIIDLNQNEIKAYSIRVTHQIVDFISRIIRKEFDAIDMAMEYIYEIGPKLIRAAKE